MMHDIIEELERRTELSTLIDQLIFSNYSDQIRLKRGQAQDSLFAALNITPNVPLRRLMNERMQAAGFRCVTIRGNQYYDRR